MEGNLNADAVQDKTLTCGIEYDHDIQEWSETKSVV